MTDIKLQCACGKIEGVAKDVSPKSGTRLICYCNDCQKFARHLDAEKLALDEHGGTDVFQLPPANVEINKGLDQIRCVRLTQKGPYRWYAGCCHTPIGNTLSQKVPFLGLISSFMAPMANKEQVVGPVRYRVFTRFAKESLPSSIKRVGVPFGLVLSAMGTMLGWKLRGLNKPFAFFDHQGKPISKPEKASISNS